MVSAKLNSIYKKSLFSGFSSERIFFFITLVMTGIIPGVSFSQAGGGQALKPANVVNTAAMLKTRYIFNFTKYIEWPAELRKGNFVIGVLGSSGMFTELIALAEKKQIGNQPLVVKTFSSAESVSGCHILYVAPEQSDLVPLIVNKLKGTTTMVLTDKEGMLKQGVAINFVIRNSKQEFELNRTGIQKSGISISSSLSALAVTVL